MLRFEPAERPQGSEEWKHTGQNHCAHLAAATSSAISRTISMTATTRMSLEEETIVAQCVGFFDDKDGKLWLDVLARCTYIPRKLMTTDGWSLACRIVQHTCTPWIPW
jgi:hypothetical protein